MITPWDPSNIRLFLELELILKLKHNLESFNAEILGNPYCRQVPLPRITNNRAQDSTRDPAHPYVQNFGPYVQTKLGQRKPEQPFVQLQWHTDVINSYMNICT